MSGPFGSQQWMYNASSGFYPFELNNSLKFEDGDSSYLSRTPASAGTRTTWTLSMWVKRANISTSQMLFSAGTSSVHYANIQSDNTIRWRNSTLDYETTQVFRDSSAWYHLVFKWDTTNSTAADRAEIYVNNEKITVYDVKTNASSSENSIWNNNVKHTLGNYAYNNTIYFDGYMTEVIFIDGTALDPSSFGETKEGIWVPKDPTGLTYGTNGFRLPFTETTSANGFNTVTYSGNGATQSIEGVGFQPDFVWLKERDNAADHKLYDSVRGAAKLLTSNDTDAETNHSIGLTSFNSDGFSIGTAGGVNGSSDTYVAWCWGGGTNDKTYTVTVVDDGGNKYRFDGHGTSSIALNLTEGATYTFNYPSAHPLRFSTTSDGTHGGGSEYTTGVTHVSSTQTTITIASGAPTLYYYCSIHSGMGGQINTNTTDAPTHAEGTILSRTKPNTDYGFSIVSYTGDNTSNNARIAHGLSSAPEMIIAKRRDSTSNWWVYHKDLNGGTDPYHYYLLLNSNAAEASRASSTNKVWGTANPDANTFGGGLFGPNGSGTKIAYCFHSVDSYQKLGTYTGTGSSGNAITGLGFKPAWLMVKRTDSTGSWQIFDTTRDPSGSMNKYVYANLNNAEASDLDISSDADGFTVNSTNNALNNASGTYIYLAIADTRDALFTSDASGNGNNWDANDLQHSDVMPDTPTDGFAVLNGITSGSSVGTLTEGNLQYQGASGQWESKISTIGVSSGKWYYEVNPISGSSSQGIFFGIINMSDTYLVSYLGNYGNTWGYYGLNGAKYNNASGVSYGATVADGDIVGVALDVDAGTLTFYKNGVSQGVAFSGLSLGGGYDQEWFVGLSCYGTAKAAINFGQDSSFSGRLVAQGNADDNGKGDFYYAPPSGYLALCNANLPDPAIDPAAGENPEDHFNTVLYTGTNGSQSVTGVGFQPDWVWWKNRSIAATHVLMDSVRGANNALYSDLTNVEGSGWSGHSFDTDGFTVDATYSGETNNIGSSFVAWNWKAGGTGVSNTDGSITSTVSANTDAGFSIVAYDSNPSGTVGHGLSQAPELIIEKKRDTVVDWIVGFTCLDGSYDFMRLNTTAAKSNAVVSAPTSTVFSPNITGNSNIAYCFHSVEGYSKFGSYVGNGSTDGPFVYTGFRPAFVIVKRTNSTGSWLMADNKRGSFNVIDNYLAANSTNAEYSPYTWIDFLSNGFKLRQTGVSLNASGSNYIYMAFAEQPFKYSNAR